MKKEVKQEAKQEVIAAFDLSTTCTGVSVATLHNNKIKSICTMPIIPPPLDPEDLGFLPKRIKVIPEKGRPFNAYLKFQGEVISKTEKERRDRMVRKASEEFRLQTTSKEIRKIIRNFKPNRILMEANMAFRSMDITRKLAEVAGALQALAIADDIPIHKINVHTARSRYDLYSEMALFAKTLTTKEKNRVDLTKETIKHIILRKYGKYGLNYNMTTDESDALLLLDYWLECQNN